MCNLSAIHHIFFTYFTGKDLSMPTHIGLSAMKRIEILDNCLRHDRWWSKIMLLQEVNRHVEAIRDRPISDATLRNDLEEIERKAGGNLLCEMRLTYSGLKKQKHYRYGNRDFSFFKKPPLEAAEYDILQQAVDLLSQLEGFEIADDLKDIVAKLQYSYPPPDNPKVVFGQTGKRLGIDLMQELYEAIRDKQVIAFDYQPFDQALPQIFMLHPYLLKEYNSRWYVVGLAEPHREIWVCALDRFKSQPRARHRIVFIPPVQAGFDAEKHFADVIGPTVRKECPVEDIVVKFKATRVPYIITKPLHHSQQLLKSYKDGSASFSFRLRYNRELLGLILGFGADVKVLKPISLAEKVKETIRKILDNYHAD